MFPLTRPVIFVNEGKGYIDIYTLEEDIQNPETMLYALSGEIEAYPQVNDVRGARGLKRSRVTVNKYKKAIDAGLIAPSREVAPPPHPNPPQLYKSCPMPPRRLRGALERFTIEMKGGEQPAAATGPI